MVCIHITLNLTVHSNYTLHFDSFLGWQYVVQYLLLILENMGEVKLPVSHVIPKVNSCCT